MLIQLATINFLEGSALPVRMAGSDGTALPLVKLGDFGADLIRFAAGKGVKAHKHVGDHILIVTTGTGWVDCEDGSQWLYPGACYLVPGSVKHAIRADTELTLVSIGNRHVPAGSSERLQCCSPLLGTQSATLNGGMKPSVRILSKEELLNDGD